MDHKGDLTEEMARHLHGRSDKQIAGKDSSNLYSVLTMSLILMHGFEDTDLSITIIPNVLNIVLMQRAIQEANIIWHYLCITGLFKCTLFKSWCWKRGLCCFD